MLFFALFLRLGYIHLFPPSAKLLQSIALNQYQTNIEIAPYRGVIYDHRKTPLAISIKAPSIAVNPKIFAPSKDEVAKLAKILAMPKDKIQKLSHKGKYFSWLKRKVASKDAEKVAELKITGLHFLSEPSRFYPSADLVSPLIGYVGLDNQGLIGLEHKYDALLKGTSFAAMGLKDARGNGLYLKPARATPQKAGNNIILTLDLAIQEIAQEALERGLADANAKKGFAIVLDPHTGRILALANYPSFNPNAQAKFNMAQTQNMAASFLFEPGSVFKPFVVATALQRKVIKATDVLNCEKSGRLLISPKVYIHDDHPKDMLSISEVLAESSNICTYKIATKLGKEAMHQGLLAFGFTGDNQDLPAQAAGKIAPFSNWSPIRFANIAFGQGLLVSGLEIAKAYAVLANGGYLVNPYLIERIETPKGEVLYNKQQDPALRILDAEVTEHVRQFLADVVTKGTGKTAKTASYSTAGKTGTAEKVDPATKAYSPTKRIANFAGFAPVSDPHLVVYVVVDEPQKKPYYGSLRAAPIFSEIVERTLRYLNVASDLEEKKKKAVATL